VVKSRLIQFHVRGILADYVEQKVKSEWYESAAEVLRDALRTMMYADKSFVRTPSDQDDHDAQPVARSTPAGGEPPKRKPTMAEVAALLADNEKAHGTEYRKCSNWKRGCTICSARFGRAPGAPDLGPPPVGTVIRPRTGADA